MKNFGIIALSMAVLLIGGGCAGDKAGLSDAAVAAADVALRLDVSLDKPYFNPTAGTYEVRLDPAGESGQIDPYGDPLESLGRLGFEVRTYVNRPGEFVMMHNGSTFYAVDGRFDHYYVPEYAGKCSSLAYAFEISGSFVSPTEARGRFVRYIDCRPANWGDFIATLVTGEKRDSGTDDRALSFPDIGPDAAADAKDAFMPDLPAFNPVPGHYSAKLDPAFARAGDSISRLDAYGFTVSVGADGRFMIKATYDQWAYYGFPVLDGIIDCKHGQGFDGYGGTHCPTDGFGFVGSFVSPTEARGIYKNLSSRCQIVNEGHFIATLDPQPDSGTLPDASLPDAGASDTASQ